MLDILAAISSVDPPSFVAWAVLAFAASMYPVGAMLGSSCSPCCTPECYYGVNQGPCAAWSTKSIRIQADGVTANISLVGATAANWCELPLDAISSSNLSQGIFPWLWPANTANTGVGAAPGIGGTVSRRDVTYQGCNYCVTVGPDVTQMLWPCQASAGSTLGAFVRIRFTVLKMFTYDGTQPGTQPGQCWPLRRPAPGLLLEYSILDAADGTEAYREHWVEYVNAFTYSCSGHGANLLFTGTPWSNSGHTLAACEFGRCCASGYRTAFGPPLYSASLV